MNRFNTGNLKNKILKITLISLLIFSYYFIIKNSNFIENITKDIEDKYSNKSINIEKFKTEVVYKSLNKIIDIDDLKISKSISINSNNKVYIYNHR